MNKILILGGIAAFWLFNQKKKLDNLQIFYTGFKPSFKGTSLTFLIKADIVNPLSFEISTKSIIVNVKWNDSIIAQSGDYTVKKFAPGQKTPIQIDMVVKGVGILANIVAGFNKGKQLFVVESIITTSLGVVTYSENYTIAGAQTV